MKKNFKKYRGIFLLGGLLLTQTVFASGPCDGSTQLCNPLQADSLEGLLKLLLPKLVDIGAIFVTLYVIYAGYLMVRAQGNPGKLTEAKNALLYALIGGLVLLGAQAISDVVLNTVKSLK